MNFSSLPIHYQGLLTYLIIINVVTFFAFGLDKSKSRNGYRRISERMLWGLMLIGGSVGALVGMTLFRHKTKKLSFQAGIAVILMIQVLLLYFFITSNK